MKNYGRMKKMITFTLVTALCVSVNMGTVTNAETLDELGSSSTNVTATYVSSEIETIYSIDIEWGSMEYTYTESGAQTWDPSTHTYSEAAEGGWDCDYSKSKSVTVTNHSNAAITVGYNCNIDESYTDVVVYTVFSFTYSDSATGDFIATGDGTQAYSASLELESAASEAYGNPDNAMYVEFYPFLEGSPGEIEDNTVIGSITITLTACE